jgi:hypothetical protein
VCIGKTAAEVIQSDTDMTSQAKVLFVAETCEIDLNKLVNDAINTALVAAQVAD